jgi:hypothetical protein
VHLILALGLLGWASVDRSAAQNPPEPVAPRFPVVDASDYGSLQEAVDSLPRFGGTVFIPGGVYHVHSTPSFDPPLVIPNGVTLAGDSREVTVLLTIEEDRDEDLVHLRGSHARLEDLTLRGPGAPGRGRGLVIGAMGEPRVGATVLNCRIYETPSWGVYVLGREDDPGTFSIYTHFDRMVVERNHTGGSVFIGSGCTTQYFDGCLLRLFRGPGLRCFDVEGTSMTNCIIEDGDDTEPYVDLEACNQMSFRQCWFEMPLEDRDAPVSRFIRTSGGQYRNITIDGCHFVRTGPAANPFAIEIAGTGRSVLITNPDLYVYERVDPEADDHILVSGQDSEVVVIGGSLVDMDGGRRNVPEFRELRVRDRSNRAVLIDAKGRVRVPRLTTAERDRLSQPSPGDMIFNTDVSRGQMYDGSEWQDLWR